MRTIYPNRVTSEPAVEPVTVEQCKRQAYIVDDDSDDGLIRDFYIPFARRVVEQLTVRSLITQTRVQYYDTLEECMFWRYGPLQSVSSITYKDTNEASQTLTSTLYSVDTKSIPARILIGYDDTYPTAITDTNSVVVTGIAGYGAAGSNVPVIYRMAILKIVSHMISNRGLCSEDEAMGVVGDLVAVEGATVEYA